MIHFISYEFLIAALFFLIYQCLISKLTRQDEFHYLPFRISINIFIAQVTLVLPCLSSQSLSELSHQCLSLSHCSHFLDFMSYPFLHDYRIWLAWFFKLLIFSHGIMWRGILIFTWSILCFSITDVWSWTQNTTFLLREGTFRVIRLCTWASLLPSLSH